MVGAGIVGAGVVGAGVVGAGVVGAGVVGAGVVGAGVVGAGVVGAGVVGAGAVGAGAVGAGAVGAGAVGAGVVGAGTVGAGTVGVGVVGAGAVVAGVVGAGVVGIVTGAEGFASIWGAVVSSASLSQPTATTVKSKHSTRIIHLKRLFIRTSPHFFFHCTIFCKKVKAKGDTAVPPFYDYSPTFSRQLNSSGSLPSWIPVMVSYSFRLRGPVSPS